MCQCESEILICPPEAGLVPTCGKICEALVNKTNSQAAGLACNVLCDVVGVKEFMEIVEKLDFLYKFIVMPVEMLSL